MPDLIGFLDAKSSGFRGSYSTWVREGFTPARVVYRPPTLSPVNGVAPQHLAPVPNGSTQVNLSRFVEARRGGFEGSYLDFLEHGYTRWPGSAPAGASPNPAAPIPPAGSPSDTVVQHIPLGPIAAMLVAQALKLQDELFRLKGPHELRRDRSLPSGRPRTLDSVVLGHDAPRRLAPLPFPSVPPSIVEALAKEDYARAIPALRAYVGRLGTMAADATLSTQLRTLRDSDRMDRTPSRSFDSVLLGTPR